MNHILICDDDEDLASVWKRSLEQVIPTDAFDVEVLSRDQLLSSLESCHGRRRRARSSNPSAADDQNYFDSADVLIVDFELLKLSEGEDTGEVSGSELAYLARCYSSCGLIIMLNELDSDFDLKLSPLASHFADVHLKGEQLANPGLWTEPFIGFRPWSWPLIPPALEKFRDRLAAIRDHLDEPIMNYLGIPEAVLSAIPVEAKRFLLPESGDTLEPGAVTFRQFATTSEGGVRSRDKLLSDDSTARVAVARLSAWMERIIRPLEDVLVDAPYIVSRFPSLLSGDVAEVTSWNMTASFTVDVSGLGIKHAEIEEVRFKNDLWSTRIVWYWPLLSNLESIREVREPWARDELPEAYVFCEDLSRFSRQTSARDFASELPTPFSRRYVIEPSSDDWIAMSKELDLETQSGRARDITRLAYGPQVLFLY